MNTCATRAALAATAACALLLLSACGGPDDTSGSGTAGSSSPTPTDTPATTPDSSPSAGATTGPVVDVTIKGDSVTPSGDRIDVEVGEPVTIDVTSDREGELHVHSTPEQELAYGVGRTTLQVTIKTPGVVDIEDHVADVVVVQLQVS